MTSFDGIDYEYDSLGNRVKVSEEESGKETTYLVDNVSGKYSQNIVETTTKDSKTSKSYNIFGHGLIGTYVEDSKESIILNHYDIRGSTVLVTDSEGDITHNIEYDEYGKLQTDLESLPTQYLYNGQYGVQTDTNSLNYMRERYYNPDLKRFMNKDILVGELDKPTTLNRYSYVNGDPISYIDPFGLARESISGEGMLGKVQLGLELAGLVPGLGVFPDLLNATIYLGTGNYKEAMWSGIGAIPLVGDSTSAIRLSNKVVNGIDGVGKGKKVSKYAPKYNHFTPYEYKGTTTVGGVKRNTDRIVYQLNSLNFDNNTKIGRTNLERIKKGKPPRGADGKIVELHHLTQKEPDTMAEVTRTMHQNNYKALHSSHGNYVSWRKKSAEMGKQYNNFRNAYWKDRYKQLTNKGGN